MPESNKKKKNKLGTDSVVLGTGQMPMASPSYIVPVCMALNTLTDDEGLLRFLVQTLFTVLCLIFPIFLSFFFVFFYLTFCLSLVLCSFFFFIFLLSSIHICRFSSSLLVHSNKSIIFWFLDHQCSSSFLSFSYF